MRDYRITGLFGLFGAVAYLIFILIAASQFPGYSHAADFISNLGAVGQPSALTMNIGFILSGILILFFGITTISQFTLDRKGLLGGLFIALDGLSVIISGVFSCEPGCNATNPTLAKSIHNGVGPIAYILFVVGIFL